jgi:hypothetical protein
MASGIYANQNHTDMTNHFLAMGVRGGLPLMIVFTAMLIAAFRVVGRALRSDQLQSPRHAFLVWTAGAMLFGYVVNFWSITLFDQSISFFYMVLAVIGAIELPAVVRAASERMPAPAVAVRAWRPAVPQAATLRTGRATVSATAALADRDVRSMQAPEGAYARPSVRLAHRRGQAR